MSAAYLIVALPLAGFVINLWLGRKLGDPGSGWLGTLASVGAFAATVVVWATLLGRSATSRSVDKNIFTWLPVAGLHVNFGLQIDPLSVTMALFVTGVGSLIHLYSIGYMKADPGYPRFFVYLNLFLFSMVVLVLSDNFLFTFLGWEGVGFCSYGLVGFWFDRETAAVAAKKAFVTNRVGDFGFMVAIFFIFFHFGSLNYSAVLGGYHAGHAFGLLAGHPGAISGVTAAAISLLLLLGAVGKSAQIPLYMWLPDAMEGPTPVSALIHAATMVTAGVYLMCRAAPILHYSHSSQVVVACIGAATALFAATIACTQDDIKRVLAYSTISQLGYMFLAVGSGGYTDGLFHMISHAFFKALLFLAAGSVIHGMRDEQNMKKMGGLGRYMPLTAVTFCIGWLAISGIPPFSGFWSKDDVLVSAWQFNKALWAVGLVTAGLTAYYMSRQVALVFFGEARWEEARPAHDEAADHEGALHPHEPDLTMRFPLVLLGVLAFAGGIVNLPYKPFNALERFLSPLFPTAIDPNIVVGTQTKVVLSVVTTALAVAGLVLGLTAWRRAERPALEPAFLRHGWYIDEGLAATVDGPMAGVAGGLAYEVDARGIDGVVGAVAWMAGAGGRQLRKLQTGYVRNYALGIGLGAVALLCYVATRVGS
ncbi:MAG TPA: NADH-quinone oxidoreductase subunit L [Acidimicrobiales bacterium]|nr:NADH-quinone oxidoreductase subunit L [Acidimicrobiales bacterium]